MQSFFASEVKGIPEVQQGMELILFLNVPLEQKKMKDKDGRWCG